MGKPLAAALGEVDFAADITEYYADNAEKIMADEPIDLLAARARRSSAARRWACCSGIMPWNFPYYQVARFAAPNLLIGNTDPAQARAAVPRVGGRDRDRSTATPGFPEGAYDEPVLDERPDRPR